MTKGGNDGAIENNTPFVALARSIWEGPFAKEKRHFSRFEAWIDLIQMARYSDKPTQLLIGNKMITWGRGQLVASIRFLATRWMWSKDKVQRFLELLVMKNMISSSITQCQTVITILSEKQGQQQGQQTGQQQGQSNPYPERVSSELPDSSKDKEPDANPDDSRTVTRTKQKEGSKKDEKKNKNVIIQYAFEVPVFIDEYNNWLLHNKEKGKTLTSRSIKGQNDFLKTHSLQDALEMIRQSVRNNWTGIFELKNQNNGKSGTNSSERRFEAVKNF